MGFFDTIDKLKSIKTELIPAKITDQDGQNAEKSRQPATIQAEKTAKTKPDRLSFLRPCPLCSSRDFIYGNAGGFFCQDCQPGIVGIPVEAGGADRQKNDPETPPPGHTDSLEADNRGSFQHPRERKNTALELERGYFATAQVWIKKNIHDLQAAGWTRAALFQRSKFRFPSRWGIAWFSVWHEKGLVVTIGRNGQIIFTFEYCDKTITQTAWPPRKPATQPPKTNEP